MGFADDFHRFKVPTDMKQRSWPMICAWFLRFWIDLEDKIDVQCSDSDGFEILDLWCGSWWAIKDIILNVPLLTHGIIHGVDIHQYPQWKWIHPCNSDVRLVTWDAQNLVEHADNSKDFIYSMALLWYPRDVLRVIQEVYRLLKPSKSAYLYAMLWVKKLSNPPLDTIMIELGIPFKIHGFTEEAHQQQQTGFYPEGCVLEIRKIWNPKNITIPLIGTSPAILNPSIHMDRAFESSLLISEYCLDAPTF